MEKNEEKRSKLRPIKKKIGISLFIIYNLGIVWVLVFTQLQQYRQNERQEKLEKRLEEQKCSCAQTRPSVDENPIIFEEQQLRDLMNEIMFSSLENFILTPRDRSKREVLSNNKLDLSSLLRGRDGRDGSPGPPGPPGIQGPAGPPGNDGRDATNLGFVNQLINVTVTKMVSTEMDKVRIKAKEIPTVSGATYVRWGRTICPNVSSLIYKGRAGGPRYNNVAGTTQFLCMPDDPEYNKAAHGTSVGTYSIYGVEYEHSSNLKTVSSSNQNVPCALCQTNGRTTKVMFPAKTRCPDSAWTKEYEGVLMVEGAGQGRTEYMCVDNDAETVPGMTLNEQGTLLYGVSVYCSSGSTSGNFGLCPPYEHRPVACTICSK